MTQSPEIQERSTTSIEPGRSPSRRALANVRVAIGLALLMSLGACSPVVITDQLDDDSATAALIGRSGFPGAGAGLEYFGYFGVPVGSQYAGMRDHVNLVQVATTDYGLIDAIAADGKKAFVSNVFDTFMWASCTTLRDSTQDPAWASFVAAITPRASAVGAFYLKDEPYGNLLSLGCSPQQVATLLGAAAARLRTAFPNTPIAVVEDPRIVDPNVTFPATIDWVGFDCYPSLHGGNFDACGLPSGAPASNAAFRPTSMQGYVDLLKQRLAPTQRIILVPEAFVTGAAPTSAQEQAEEIIARRTLDLARSDSRIVAVLPFVNGRQTYEAQYWGVLDMPTVKAIYRPFGLAVTTQVALGKPVVSYRPTNSYAQSPQRLTDGSLQTLAYPGDFSLDYEVDLLAAMRLHRVRVDFDYFGTSPAYVSHWLLSGTAASGAEVTIASGGSAPGATIEAWTAEPLRKLRIRAQSDTNWIGATELSAFGAAAPVAAIAINCTTGPGSVNCSASGQGAITSGFWSGNGVRVTQCDNQPTCGATGVPAGVYNIVAFATDASGAAISSNVVRTVVP